MTLDASSGGSQPRDPQPRARALSEFTVELEVYSGPYEWLLALILRDELEIFEIPLRELVGLYRTAHPAPSAAAEPEEAVERALERDTDFVDSATSLVLLKSRTLLPASEPEAEDGEEQVSPEELAERLSSYLKIKRASEALAARLQENAGHYDSAHEPPPRAGELRVDPERLAKAIKRASARLKEPPTSHMGPITVTLQELAEVIRTSLSRSPGTVSFEAMIRDMDRLRTAVAFAAALSLASEGHLSLYQSEPLGPLTLKSPG